MRARPSLWASSVLMAWSRNVPTSPETTRRPSLDFQPRNPPPGNEPREDARDILLIVGAAVGMVAAILALTYLVWHH